MFNVHGHIHDRVYGDNKHVCVSVEHTNYTPVLLSELLISCGVDTSKYKEYGEFSEH